MKPLPSSIHRTRGDLLRVPLRSLARALADLDTAHAALSALVESGQARRQELRVALARLNTLMGDAGQAAQKVRRMGIVEIDLGP